MISVATLILALAASPLIAARPINYRRADLERRAADFGKCTTPELIFAKGLDNRKETSFEPKDLASFNHGSAQNPAIITQFMCDTLINSCGANAEARSLCLKAQDALSTAPPKTGGQADAFNKVMGITTNFAAVQAFDDQGRAVGAAGAAAAAPAAGAAVAPAAPATAADNGAAAAAAGGAADFGSCSAPSIIFAKGLEGRKETAFEPKDLKSFNHGSAQAIGIIAQFECDQLTNSCKANQAAKDLCTKAQAAAQAAPPKTGAQADAFNAVFGEKTNFAAVQAIDDQGRVVGAAAAAAAAPVNVAIATPVASACAADVTVTVTAAAAVQTPPTNNAVATAGGADFGTCSTPSIIFAAGLDNRRETAFEPKDLKSFNHGSAQNIGVITQAICDGLTNNCKANQAAKDLCTQAQAAANGAAAKTGAQADAFNAVFGEKTNFAAVQVVDDTGKAVGAPAAGAAAAAPAAGAAAAAAPVNNAAAAAGAANFGSCSAPSIIFAKGLDNRKETAFEPKDLKSFNHGSAQAIGIIAQFECDTLTNSCKANQAAKDLCTKAQAAAQAAPPKTGAQADAFNAVFGEKTNFAAVQAIDDQGRVVA